MIIYTWQLLLSAVAGWASQEHRDVIAYIMEENRVLKKHLAGRRLLLTDDQRRRLAVKARVIGRRMLREVSCLFTPDTIMRWYARRVAMKCDGTRKRGPGRPRKPEEIRGLVVRIARENRGWGYTRIMSALRNLKCDVGRTTVQRILADHGLEPSPQRSKRMSWAEFRAAHWEQIAAADFFTVELMTLRGLVRYSIRFVMELSTRAVYVAGIDSDTGNPWMKQVARNLTDGFDGFLLDKTKFIHDRDPRFSWDFRKILKDAGVSSVRLPARSPNLNAYAERFVRSIKSECLSKRLFFSEAALRRAIGEYIEHYHTERNHQGLDNRRISPPVEEQPAHGPVECRKRLGGLLKFYRRRAS